MSLLARLRGYGILILALAIFSGSIFYSFDRILNEEQQIARTAEENVVWAPTEAEVDLYRLLDVLREYGVPDSTVSHDDLQLRFDVLVGRLQRLHEGPNAAKLLEIEGAQQTVSDLLTRLTVLAPEIALLKKDDRGAIYSLINSVHEFAGPLRTLTVNTLQQADRLMESQHQRLHDAYLRLAVYFAGVALAGTLLLLLLFRGIGRANRLLRERELTEALLRDSEQRFRDYAASSSDWLWETDALGRFTYFSKGYLEKVGLNALEILGKSHEELAHMEGDEAAWERQRETIAAHKPFRDFKYRLKGDGVMRQLKVSGVPIFDGEGAFLGYRGTGTDLTAQVEAEAEAMRARTLLHEAVASLDEGFALFDPQDRLVQCNARYREIHAGAAEMLRPGTGFAEIARAAAYRGAFAEALGREESWIEERLARHRRGETPYDLRLKDGRWIQARETVLDNGWQVETCIDITHHKRREEALRREALIWEQMSDGVIVTDLAGDITNWNPAAERMFGYAAAEVTGKTPRILYAAPSASLGRDLLAAALAAVERQGSWAGEIDFRRKDGSAGTADTVVVPLRDDGGNRIAVIWVNHDVTARKESEAALRAAKEQAELANQAKSQFLATMSHEIRTPMNGMLGMIDLLLDSKLGHEQRGYAETARKSGDALVTIIDDILDFSKMEAGKLALERVEFALRHLVEGVVDLLAPRAQAKGVEIACFTAPEVPNGLRGDPGRLRQVLLNLAGNAVKFTEKGGVAVLVSSAGAAAQEARIKFEIVDTGIGIPDELQGGLFAEFSQADPSYTRRYGGTGLGLAISKKLTELMGGSIGFTSKLGAGSSFWFTVELEIVPGTAAAPAPHRLAGSRVLVADDNPVAAGILERQLEAAGHGATTVSDREAALTALADAAAAHEPFALALIDQQLGRESGAALAEAIRRQPALATMPLVLLVPLGGRIGTGAAEAARFQAALNKPVHQAALADCLDRIAEGGAALAPLAAQDARESEERVDHGDARPEAADASHQPVFPERSVLLVEDSPVNQIVANAMLAKLVGAVDTANNGLEAVAAVESKDYDLVLMDVAMPEMDGVEATRRIRAMAGHKGRVPIVAISAHALDSDRERCIAAGMDDYLTKPIDLAGLHATVSRWLAADEKPAAPAVLRRRRKSDRIAGRAAAAEAGPAVLDPATLDQLAADTDPKIARELVKTFVLETVARLDHIAHAADRRDFATLAREAHSLKSSSGTFGALALQEHAKALEFACRDGKAERALLLIPPLRGLVASATDAMERHFQDGG